MSKINLTSIDHQYQKIKLLIISTMLINLIKKLTRPLNNSIALSQIIKSRYNYNLLYTFSNANNDIQSFADIDILNDCKKYLVEKFPTLTQIQKKTLKTILEGNDLIGIAKTGSGKTLAYGLPALMNAQKSRSSSKLRGKNPLILVISPTRQLAVQIEQHLSQLCKLLDLRIMSIYGGKDKFYQIRKIKLGTDILIATPGRLLDFVNGDILKLNQIEYVVLDEADRILDIGFEESLKQILRQLPQKRQTILFSATLDKQIKLLAKDYTTNPVQIQIGQSGITLNEDIEQKFILRTEKSKEQIVLDILEENKDKKIIIFTNTKILSKQISQELNKNQFKSTYLNGDLVQQIRQRNLNAFKKNKVNILAATDVAARGLDINDVNIIINYDNPSRLEDYVHRIGRTGRAGKKGQSITFLDRSVSPTFLKDLIKAYQKANIPVPIDLINFQKQIQISNASFISGRNQSRNRNISRDSRNRNISRDSMPHRKFGQEPKADYDNNKYMRYRNWQQQRFDQNQTTYNGNRKRSGEEDYE